MALVRLTVDVPNLSAKAISNHRVANTDRGRDSEPPPPGSFKRYNCQDRVRAAAAIP